MATLTIRNLDDSVRERLRVRAAEHGRSMEAEVREILTAAVTEKQDNLAVALLEAFQSIGGVELDIPPRTDEGMSRIPDFSGPEFGTYEDEE